MPTVQEVIDKLRESVRDVENTVDTLKSGNVSNQVSGIATCFMPAYHVLQEAATRNLNLVIAHEAPFYNHRDDVDILTSDPVYIAKKAFIEESGLAIFRFHDYMHRRNPDLVVDGLIRDLGWEGYVESEFVRLNPTLPLDVSPVVIPEMKLEEIANHVKRKLGVPFVRVTGELSMRCSRIGFMPGYRGSGDLCIPYFQKADLDLIITGEGPEWETPEYIRDAVAQGRSKALIVLGHQNSEVSGMKYLAQSLKRMYPSLPVEHIVEQQPFQFV